jgi:hypothetical protein
VLRNTDLALLESWNLREEATQELTLRSDMTLRLESINETQRTVDAVLATENRSIVFDMQRWESLEEILLIEGCELPTQIPLFDTHPQLLGRVTTEAMRGSIRNLRIERRQLVGTLHFFDDEPSDRLWNLVRGGHCTDMSTGNVPLEKVLIPPGGQQTVAGKKYKAGELPLLITTRWRPREGSCCPWGADPRSKIRTQGQGNSHGNPPAPTNRSQENHAVPENLRAYLETLGLAGTATESQAWAFYHNLRGEQRAQAETLRGDVTAPPAPAEPQSQTPATTPTAPQTTRSAAPPAPSSSGPPTTAPAEPQLDTVRAAAIQAERLRVQRIEELASTDVPREIVRQAITEGWTEARASTEFLSVVRTRRAPAVPGAPAIHSRSHEGDCTLSVLQAAMLVRANLNPIEGHVRYEEGCMIRAGIDPARRQDLERSADLAWRYRDLSMVDICREAIRLDGGNIPFTREQTIRSAMSGGSLAAIFTTTVGAQLLASYEAAPDTTAGWTRDAEVPNFQTNERVQMGKGARLKKLPRGKTAEHASRDASLEEYKIARYAEQFVADEQDFIDDNFGALTTMPEEFGEAARQLRPDLVYSILLANAALGADNIALFDATDHKNLRTSAALAAATLKVAVTDMGIQTQGGRVLNLAPFALLVPKGLKHTASELVNSSEIRDTTASRERGTRNAIQDDNLLVISDGRLDNGVIDPATETVHSGSSTTWFLAARGGRYTIEVGYRRGTGRAPMVRSFVLSQGQWGMGWDINMDIGAKALDFRGLHKNTQ